MKKVIYSIKRKSKKEDITLTGIGCISETDLVIARISEKTGAAYIDTFDDCIKHCFPIPNKANEYKGEYSKFVKFEKLVVDDKFRNPEDNTDKGYELIEAELHYKIWFKIIQD